MVRCLPSGFELYARLWRCCPPEVVEETLWLPRAPVEEAAQLIWRVRPVSYYAWSGFEQASNVTPKYWAAPCASREDRTMKISLFGLVPQKPK